MKSSKMWVRKKRVEKKDGGSEMGERANGESEEILTPGLVGFVEGKSRSKSLFCRLSNSPKRPDG